jgi:hypothetical protein
MAQVWTVSTLAALTLVGAGAGVYLGQGAIADINPLYFSMPGGTKSYAALTPHNSQDVYHAAAARTDDGAGLGDGCVACRTYPEEYLPRRDAEIDAYLEGGEEPEPELFAAVAQGAQYAEAPNTERVMIETYSRYPIDNEEALRHEQAMEAVEELETPAQLQTEIEPVGL